MGAFILAGTIVAGLLTATKIVRAGQASIDSLIANRTAKRAFREHQNQTLAHLNTLSWM
jgi:hypothetical protein